MRLGVLLVLLLASVSEAQTVVGQRLQLSGGPCTLRSGSGAPGSGLGVVCDTYYRTDSPYTIYVKTGASQWIEAHPAAGTTGDLVYGATGTTLGRLPAVATGQVLVSAGTSTAPVWSASPSVTLLTATGTGHSVDITNANPGLWIYENDAAADNGKWSWRANNGTLFFRANNDAESASNIFFQIERTGTTVDSINLGGTNTLPETGYSMNLGALTKKFLTLHAAELWVETLVAQNTIATIGGRVLVGPTTVLTSDLTSGATSIIVKHNQMNSGDRVYMEANGLVEFMAITSGASGTGPYTYSVTRNLDGTGANAWIAGDAVFNTGQTGSGFIDLYSYASATFPGYQAVFNFDAALTAYSANYADAATFPLLGDSANNTVNDAAYFGAPATWSRLSASVLTPLSLGTGVLAYEYWNGAAWTALPGTAGSFAAAGPGYLSWTAPPGWATVAVNGVTAYWIRIRVTTVGSGITAGLWQTVRRGQQQWGPTIVGNVRTSSTYNDWYPRWAIGNLDGMYGYSSATYGAVFGDELGTNVTVDATNGFRIRSVTTNKFVADTSGNLSIVGDLSVGTAGIIRSGATSYASGTGYVLDYNAGTPRMRIGTTAGNRLAWDGSDLTLVSSSLILGGGLIRSSGATALSTGTGYWLDASTGTPTFRVGVPAGNRISWDGTNLTLTSATVGLGSGGVAVSPAAFPGDHSTIPTNGYKFTVPTGGMGVFASDDAGGTRTLSVESAWTGTGNIGGAVNVVLVATHNPSSGGTLNNAQIALSSSGSASAIALTAGLVTISGVSGDGTGKVLCIKADTSIGTCNASSIGASTCTCG